MISYSYISTLQYLKGAPELKEWLLRGQRFPLHNEPCGEDEGQLVQVALGSTPLQVLSTGRTINHWNKLP